MVSEEAECRPTLVPAPPQVTGTVSTHAPSEGAPDGCGAISVKAARCWDSRGHARRAGAACAARELRVGDVPPNQAMERTAA